MLSGTVVGPWLLCRAGTRNHPLSRPERFCLFRAEGAHLATCWEDPGDSVRESRIPGGRARGSADPVSGADALKRFLVTSPCLQSKRLGHPCLTG
jgi:hypothetical protein